MTVPPDLSAIATLTERERIVLRLVWQHHSSKSIANQLGLSPHTVDQRLRSAIRKLEVGTRFEAARLLAQAEGLGDADPGASAEPIDATDPAAPGDSAFGWSEPPTPTDDQPLIYQLADVAAPAEPFQFGAVGAPTPVSAPLSDGRRLRWLPAADQSSPVADRRLRAVMVVTIALVSMLGFGLFFTGLQALGTMARSLR